VTWRFCAIRNPLLIYPCHDRENTKPRLIRRGFALWCRMHQPVFHRLLAIPVYEPVFVLAVDPFRMSFAFGIEMLFAPLSHADDHMEQPMSILCQAIFLVPASVFCRRDPQDAPATSFEGGLSVYSLQQPMQCLSLRYSWLSIGRLRRVLRQALTNELLEYIAAGAACKAK
jgi:hypothetical protein